MRTAPSLHRLQTEFMEWVLGHDSAGVADSVRGNGLTASARLGIYRNIVFNNLTATLATAYPTVKTLVGDDFFETIAARYIREQPSLCGNLQAYGDRFPMTLANASEAQSLPYLADVARLEWARQECLLAADAASFDPRELTAVPETRQITLRLALHPSLRLVDSQHPILDIWLFCQTPGEARLQLDGKGQQVMLWREATQIAMRAIDAGLYTLLTNMSHGETLADANAAALVADADLALDAVLPALFADGLITGYDF